MFKKWLKIIFKTENTENYSVTKQGDFRGG